MIPKNRLTHNQNHIQANSSDFGLSSEEVKKKMEFHSGIKIEWDTPDEWILSDTGYSLQFRLKNNPENPVKSKSTVTEKIEKIKTNVASRFKKIQNKFKN